MQTALSQKKHVCTHCSSPGHLERTCRHRKRKMKADKKNQKKQQEDNENKKYLLHLERLAEKFRDFDLSPPQVVQTILGKINSMSELLTNWNNNKTLKTQVQDLNQQVSSFQLEIEKIRQMNSNLCEEQKQNQEELKQLRFKLQEKDEKIGRLQQDLSIEKETSQLNGQLHQVAEKELQLKSQEVSSLNEELEILDRSNLKQNEELIQLNQELQKIREENNLLKKRTSQLSLTSHQQSNVSSPSEIKIEIRTPKPSQQQNENEDQFIQRKVEALKESIIIQNEIKELNPPQNLSSNSYSNSNHLIPFSNQGSQAQDKQICRFGSNCRNRSATHFERFTHNQVLGQPQQVPQKRQQQTNKNVPQQVPPKVPQIQQQQTKPHPPKQNLNSPKKKPKATAKKQSVKFYLQSDSDSDGEKSENSDYG